MRRNQRSPEAQAYRALYKRARWLRLRKAQLQKQPLCERHLKRGKVVAASVVHHIKEHKGNEAIFFDASNLESLCPPCHDSDAQSEERTGVKRVRISVSGWPEDED